MRIETGAVLILLRGNSMGLRDGRSIFCAGIGFKRSKLFSFVKSVAGCLLQAKNYKALQKLLDECSSVASS